MPKADNEAFYAPPPCAASRHVTLSGRSAACSISFITLRHAVITVDASRRRCVTRQTLPVTAIFVVTITIKPG